MYLSLPAGFPFFFLRYKISVSDEIERFLVYILHGLSLQDHSTNDAIKFPNYHILVYMIHGKMPYMVIAE